MKCKIENCDKKGKLRYLGLSFKFMCQEHYDLYYG